MSREPTIARIFSKKELHQKVIQSVENCGWNVTILNSLTNVPLRIAITYGGRREQLALYIWNISHGGKTRSEDEYRIQIKGDSLELGAGYKTLLLGWFDEDKVFVAFNAFKHRLFGASPSVQVKRDALRRGKDEGLAFQTKIDKKKRQEIVVTFQPENFMVYVEDVYPQYHRNEVFDVPASEMEIIKSRLDVKLPDTFVGGLPTERRTAVVTINKKVREAKFQKYVFSLYTGKCAICGIQARLTEAAHIIPVKDEGSDELVNGVLLCRNHHRAFDIGLLAISGDYAILLNKRYADWLTRISEDAKLKEFLANSRIGEKLTLPSDARFYPKKEYLIENCKSKGINQLPLR